MSCNYAENLSPYENKGICGAEEVAKKSLIEKSRISMIYFISISRFLMMRKR